MIGKETNILAMTKLILCWLLHNEQYDHYRIQSCTNTHELTSWNIYVSNIKIYS